MLGAIDDRSSLTHNGSNRSVCACRRRQIVVVPILQRRRPACSVFPEGLINTARLRTEAQP